MMRQNSNVLPEALAQMMLRAAARSRVPFTRLTAPHAACRPRWKSTMTTAPAKRIVVVATEIH